MHDRQAILALLPATRRQILAQCPMAWDSLKRRLDSLMADNLAHIGEWRQSVNPTGGSRRAPVFYPGPGENVPCNLPPTPRKEVIAKFLASPKGEAYTQRHLAAKRVERVPTWAGRYIPPADPLTAAFYSAPIAPPNFGTDEQSFSVG